MDTRWAARLILLAFVASCGGNSTQQVSERFRAAPSEVSFGVVPLGGTFSEEVELHNEGVTRVTVSAVDLPVGFEVEPIQVVLPAGQSVSVEVKFRPRSQGKFAEAIRFQSSTSDAEASLLVSGEAIKGALSFDEQLSFGDVSVGKTKSLELSIRSLVDVSLQAEYVITGSSDFEAEPSKLSFEPGGSAVLALNFSPSARGSVVGAVRIFPCGGCPDETLTVQGRGVEYGMTASPERLDFGTVALGSSRVEAITVTNSGDGPIRFLTPTWESGNTGEFSIERLDVPDPLGIGESGRVFIRFSPREADAFGATLRLGDGEGKVSALVQVQGTGGGPRLVVSPSDLALGLQPFGRSISTGVTVANAGLPGEALVTSITVEGPEAGLVQVLEPILPHDVGRQPVDVRISVSTAKVGELRADVLFHTSLPGQSTLRVPLSAIVHNPKTCDLTVDWPEVRFGRVPHDGPEVVRKVKMINDGGTPCLIWDRDIRGRDASGFSFFGDFEPFHLAPGGEHSIEVRFDPKQVPMRLKLDATVVVWHGPIEDAPLEVPILAEATNLSFVKLAPRRAQFEATPVGRATVITLVFEDPGDGGTRQLWLTEDSSDGFRFPAGQTARPPRGRKEVRLAFIPRAEGVHRGLLAISNAAPGSMPLFVDLEGIAEEPCSECDWPSSNCGNVTSLEVEESMLLSDSPGYECNWFAFGERAADWRGTIAPNFSLEIDSTFSCEGRLVPHLIEPLTLANLRVRADGRAAYCEVPIQVEAPPGLWVEAVAPRTDTDMGILERMSLSVLRGDGGDPSARDAWLDDEFACTGDLFAWIPTSCPWGSSGSLGAPVFLPGGLFSVRLHMEEPGAQEGYHLGLFAKPPWGTTAPVDVRIYCDRQLVANPIVTAYQNDFVVQGHVEFAPTGGCTFTPDGLTRFPYILNEAP